MDAIYKISTRTKTTYRSKRELLTIYKNCPNIAKSFAEDYENIELSITDNTGKGLIAIYFTKQWFNITIFWK